MISSFVSMPEGDLVRERREVLGKLAEESRMKVECPMEMTLIPPRVSSAFPYVTKGCWRTMHKNPGGRAGARAPLI